ncbi:MAG: hypothetical protein KJ905_01625 [Nanoarchaeota archaeon]|nr:hypothetical protein [Nanoarchaeota archaeon]MBU1501454.1 hypothetical protein [Nanoarchaeota archaeon]MBU2459120.1 hypothetical protein [Nanoarchaeota archaeon]
MVNITLQIDDNTYLKMKKFSEIEWSEFVKKIIEQRLMELENVKYEFFADENILSENWLSKEDNEAWKNL